MTSSCQVSIRFAGFAAFLLIAASASAEQQLVLAPESVQVSFQFRATLHDVHGRLDASEGSLRFDEQSGAAGGRVVLDARSATTDNERRDRHMHADVLASERYPEIVFEAERLEVQERGEGFVRVTLGGRLTLRGTTKPLAIPATVGIEGDAVQIDADFAIDYTEWGVPNVGNFVMRLDDVVSVRVQAQGRLVPAGARP